MLAETPKPPYHAVIFTSIRTQQDQEYDETAELMVQLAQQQPGFLGLESARGEDGLGITVSYWQSEDAIKQWKNHVDHQVAQRRGKQGWYQDYRVRVCVVARSYGL